MPIFYHDGIHFNYESHGIGHPLVMLHGLTGEIGTVRGLVAPICDHRAILMDSRAHGATTPLGDPSQLSFSQFSQDLAALLSSLGIQRACIAGVSMGAGIATRVAFDFPELVQKLILIRPAWLTERSPPNLQLHVLAGQFLQIHGASRGRLLFDEHPAVIAANTIDPALVSGLRRQFMNVVDIERAARLVQLADDCPVPSWNVVQSLSVPTLVLGCHTDSVHPWSYAETWAKHVPNSMLAEVTAKSIDESAYTSDVQNSIGGFVK